MLRLCKGGVYIHVWTRVILRIVESESTPKGEQFQVGGHEQSWLFGPLPLTWKLPWQCFVCSNLRGLGGTAVVMEVVFFFSFYHLYIFFALQLDNIFQESRNHLVLLLYNQQ